MERSWFFVVPPGPDTGSSHRLLLRSCNSCLKVRFRLPHMNADWPFALNTFRHMDVIEEVRLFFASEIMIMTYSWHERRGTNIAYSFLTFMRMPWWSAGALSKRTLETWWMFLAERYMQHVLNTRNRTAGLWKSIKVYCINRTFLISSDLRPSPWVKMWKNSAASRNFAICLFKDRPFQHFSCPFWSFGSGFDLT